MYFWINFCPRSKKQGCKSIMVKYNPNFLIGFDKFSHSSRLFSLTFCAFFPFYIRFCRVWRCEINQSNSILIIEFLFISNVDRSQLFCPFPSHRHYRGGGGRYGIYRDTNKVIFNVVQIWQNQLTESDGDSHLNDDFN